MDEQGKKINLGSFFERTDSIDKISSGTLSGSNSAMTAVGANKLLIESLQMSIETMQTQIRDIANYIIIENKLEKDEREDRLLEEQDAKQKQGMIDRALGMQGVKGDKGSTGQPGEFGQQGGGGGSFLGGLLKAIAVGGIAALALPLLPVIAPLILKVIGGGLIVAATAAIGKQIAKALTGPIQNIGKGLQSLGSKSLEIGQKAVGGIKRGVGGVADFLTGGIFDFDKKGNSKFDEIRQMPINAAKSLVGNAKESGVNAAKSVVGGVKELGSKTKTGLLGGIDALSGNLLDLDKKGGETFGGGRVFGGILDAVTGNRYDFDKKNESVDPNELTFRDIDQLKSSVSTNSAAIQTITNPAPQTVKNTNSPVTVQNSKPQVTYTQIKTTKPSIPFINTLGNQYLSLSPHTNKLPPEIARMIQ